LGGAALASMDEKGRTTTHFARDLRIQVEGAGALDSLMHHIHTLSKLVGCGGKRADIGHALVIWIEIAFSISTIGHCIDSPIT